MKKVVLTIREDVCNANNKSDENVRLLLDKMGEYGTVTDFDAEVKTIKDEYQDNINKLTAQLNRIQANDLKPGEIAVLNAIRKHDAEVAQEKDAEIAKYMDLVAGITAKMHDMVANVREAVKDE